MTAPVPHDIRIGIGMCTPMPFIRAKTGAHVMDPITVQWHRKRMALAMPTNFNQIEVYCDGMEIGSARNEAVKRCLEHDPVPQFLFFLDNDVLAEYDAVTKLLYRASHFPDYHVYAGVYCVKGMNPPDPLVYAGDGTGPYWDWTVGDLLRSDTHGITGTHMGLTLIRTSLFNELPWDDEQPWFQSTNSKELVNGCLKTHRGTEDLFFYKTARKRGVDVRILVDTSVLAGHIEKETGMIYGLPWDSGPVERQKALYAEKNDKPKEEELIALDIGCGETHRQWEGYKTFRMDLRPEVKPDYCQDTRAMNLPNNHFDLVASSHHLEHIPRFEQEKVWAEIFRITKPGGQVEHIVPSLEWAASNIVEGHTDEHVINVLYGAQEAHGYARELNLHYFGYTQQLAVELARSAGFVDVTCEDWKSNESLGYNLVIRGHKPAGENSVHKSPRPKIAIEPKKKPEKKRSRRPTKKRKTAK